MAGVNKVILLGNLGADPVVKSFQNGGKIANLRLATSERWKDKQSGERKERVEWHSIVIHSDGLVGVVERYLRKGSKIYIEGQLRTRKWQDRDGNDRYSTEVAVGGMHGALVMLDGAKDGEKRQGSTASEYGYSNSQQPDNSGWGYEPLDDEVPFEMLPRRIPKPAKRSARWRSQAHLSFVRQHECSMCGSATAIEAAHVRLGGAAGIGQKPDDYRAVSLCRDCHRRQHTVGEASFWAGRDIEAVIDAFCKASPRRAQIVEARR